MKLLQALAIIFVGIFPHLIIPSDGLWDVRINKNAALEKSIFEGLPNEMGVELFGCDDENRMPNRKYALNYRLVNKDWSKLFVFFMQPSHLKLQGNFFGYYGHTLEPHDNIAVEPQFNNKDTQQMVDLMRQKKLVMGKFSISKTESSEIGVTGFFE